MVVGALGSLSLPRNGTSIVPDLDTCKDVETAAACAAHVSDYDLDRGLWPFTVNLPA